MELSLHSSRHMSACNHLALEGDGLIVCESLDS